MHAHRADHTGNLTRRTWLGLATAGVGLGPLALAGQAAQDEKKAARKGRIIGFVRQLGGQEGSSGFIGIDPDDGTWQLLVAAKAGGYGRLSPDGKTLIYLDIDDRNKPGLWAAELGADKPARQVAESRGGPICWSPDGKQIVASSPKVGADGRPEFGTYEVWRVDADGSHRTDLPLAKDQIVRDWSADGRWLLTSTVGIMPGTKQRVTLVRPDGTGQRVVYDGTDEELGMRFSPDGREVAIALWKRKIQDGRSIVREFSLLMARAEGEGRRVLPLGENFALGPCWSPDGKRLAMAMVTYKREANGDLVGFATPAEGDPRIGIMDADGKNLRSLPLPEGMTALYDWR